MECDYYRSRNIFKITNPTFKRYSDAFKVCFLSFSWLIFKYVVSCASWNEQANLQKQYISAQVHAGKRYEADIQMWRLFPLFLRTNACEREANLSGTQENLLERAWQQVAAIFSPLSPPPPPEILPIHALFLKFFSLSLTQRLHLPFCVTSPSTPISPSRSLSQLKKLNRHWVFFCLRSTNMQKLKCGLLLGLKLCCY